MARALAFQAEAPLGPSRKVSAQALERHGAVEAGIASLVDLAHAPCSDRFDDSRRRRFVFQTERPCRRVADKSAQRPLQDSRVEVLG